MRALVTGASGFLGGRLTQVLEKRAEMVRILARPSQVLKHLGCLPVEVVRGDLSDTKALAVAMRGITHVFHCAALATDWAPPQAYFDSNVTGTENLLSAARESGAVQRFLHVSTTDVYGYPERVCDESGPLVDTGLPYNRTKILGERAAWDSGLPVTVVRPATIYGPRSVTFGTDIVKLLRQKLMAVFDGGRARGGFLYIDNAVDAIIAAATSNESLGRAYNLADDTGATWRTYVDRMADGLSLPRPRINLPSGVALALADGMEAPHRYLKFPGRPLLTRHAVYLLARDQEFPIERARRELGFTPAIGFDEGIARTIEWLQRN